MLGRSESRRLQKRASSILAEDAKEFSDTSQYHVFLSHSYEDAEVILGVKKAMKTLGVSVYVDWIDDPAPDRSAVTSETAKILRTRMQTCKCLVYAHSPNTPDSRWMPWELGYFDGLRPGYLWILPLVVNYDSEFTGQEYLGLYPTVEQLESLSGKLILGFEAVQFMDVVKSVTLTEAATGVYGGLSKF